MLRQDNTDYRLTLLICLIPFLIWALVWEVRMYNLSVNASSTVARTTEQDNSTGVIYFEYFVKGDKYTGVDKNTIGAKVPNHKYLLIYNKKKPIVSRIFFNYPMSYKMGSNLDTLINVKKIRFHFWHMF